MPRKIPESLQVPLGSPRVGGQPLVGSWVLSRALFEQQWATRVNSGARLTDGSKGTGRLLRALGHDVRYQAGNTDEPFVGARQQVGHRTPGRVSGVTTE